MGMTNATNGTLYVGFGAAISLKNKIKIPLKKKNTKHPGTFQAGTFRAEFPNVLIAVGIKKVESNEGEVK